MSGERALKKMGLGKAYGVSGDVGGLDLCRVAAVLALRWE